MMKYLVTGAAGFIGGHIARTLALSGHDVTGVDIKACAPDCSFNSIAASIEDIDSFTPYMIGCDGVFHMAAIASVPKTFDDPQGSYAVNVTGTRNIFQAALDAGNIPVVYASSAAIYGDNTALPLNEAESPKPLSPYAEHKLQNEKDAKEFGKRGLPSFGLRFFNIYGPGQDPSSPYSGVISIFHDRLESGEPITIYGDGKQTRDFVFVGDTVQGCIAAMRHSSTDALIANICRGETIEIRELLQILAHAMGKTPELSFAEGRSGDIRYSKGDPSYMEKITGFVPRIGMKDGLEELIEAPL